MHEYPGSKSTIDQFGGPPLFSYRTVCIYKATTTVAAAVGVSARLRPSGPSDEPVKALSSGRVARACSCDSVLPAAWHWKACHRQCSPRIVESISAPPEPRAWMLGFGSWWAMRREKRKETEAYFCNRRPPLSFRYVSRPPIGIASLGDAGCRRSGAMPGLANLVAIQRGDGGT